MYGGLARAEGAESLALRCEPQCGIEGDSGERPLLPYPFRIVPVCIPMFHSNPFCFNKQFRGALFAILLVCGCSSSATDGADAASDGGCTGTACADVASTDSGAGDAAAGCVASGGTLGTESCCTSSGDFPSSCLVGACGCAPANSHSVQVCNCPSGQCFDGTRCKPGP